MDLRTMHQEKPTFQQMRLRYTLPLKEIADRAGVRLIHAYRMEIGRPVSVAFAQRLQWAFSCLTQRSFSFEEMGIALVEECRTERVVAVSSWVSHRAVPLSQGEGREYLGTMTALLLEVCQ